MTAIRSRHILGTTSLATAMLQNKAIKSFINLLTSKRNEKESDLKIYPIRNYKNWLNARKTIIVIGKKGAYIDLKHGFKNDENRIGTLSSSTIQNLKINLTPSRWDKMNIANTDKFIIFDYLSPRGNKQYRIFVEYINIAAATQNREATNELVEQLIKVYRSATPKKYINKLQSMNKVREKNIKTGGQKFSELGLNIVKEIHPEVENYFINFIPHEIVEINFIQLFPLDEIKKEIFKYMPGMALKNYGFITIAADGNGNNYVLEIKTGKIYLADHERDFSNQNNISKQLSEVSTSIPDFLEKFSNGKLP